MKFRNYYQTELTYLRDVGRIFAEKYPGLAGMLAERGGDPDVERLLEGFAFVAARFRQRIDDSIPELAESLAELLVPQLLKIIPASTIVEFRSGTESTRGAQALAKDIELHSVPVRGTRCRFRTTRDLTLLPVSLSGLRLDDAQSTSPSLSLRLAVPEGASSAVFRQAGLRLHLHGELPTATQLYLWLSAYVASVSVRAADGRCVELGPRVIRAVGLDAQDALVPWPLFSPDGPRLLLEYLNFPSKFLFFDVVDLDRAAQLEGTAFELVVRFNKPPPLPARLPGDVVRLHCVPAVNLFEVAADPLRVTAASRPFLLRAQGIEPLHAEVFEVRSVVGVAADSRERRDYAAFHAFRHVQFGVKHPGFYKLSRERSPVDDGLHSYLRLGGTEPAEAATQNETLSVELLCTNRSLPNEMQLGDLSVPTADTPSGTAFSNISQLSRPVRPPIGEDLVWRFVSHLACTRRTLSDLESLKAALFLYNREDEVDFQLGAANRARIDAIRTLHTRPIVRAHRGAAVRGTLFALELELPGFASEGDAYLFSAVLHRFFALGVPLNSFADVQVTLLPTRRTFRFRAELGEA